VRSSAEGLVIAGGKVKGPIVEVGKKVGVVCPQGSDWLKGTDGYRCGCSGHENVEAEAKGGEGKEADIKSKEVLVVADAKMKEQIAEVGKKPKEVVVIADAKTQQKIAEVGKKMGVVCPQGSDRRRGSDGCHCGCSGHFLTFRQVGFEGYRGKGEGGSCRKTYSRS
jgi:hypothetical protein